MNDATDLGMDEGTTEAEVDKAYQEVCDEVGIELGEQLATASSKQMDKDVNVH